MIPVFSSKDQENTENFPFKLLLPHVVTLFTTRQQETAFVMSDHNSDKSTNFRSEGQSFDGIQCRDIWVGCSFPELEIFLHA